MTMRVPGLDGYDLRLDYSFSSAEVAAALAITPQDVQAPQELSFSKNVFLPLTTACRYSCAYCVYYDVPGQEKLMTEQDVRAVLEQGAKAGCKEALFTFGDTPDARYQALHETLKQRGFATLHDFHVRACMWALECGLLPHSNPGDTTWEQMAQLKEVNASLGVMLETTAEVPAHSGRRRKTPGHRLQTLEYAGRLKVPFTTGLLIGIGEAWEDRALSLLCLRRLHEAYGHIQEVIIQNVVPNRRWKQPIVPLGAMRRMVAMARAVLPADVEIQVPPNLSPVEALLDCGVGDLGGVSPVTDDYINPDYQWPALAQLEALARRSGKTLKERLAVYSRYLPDPQWFSPRLHRFLQRTEFRSFHPQAPQAALAQG